MRRFVVEPHCHHRALSQFLCSQPWLVAATTSLRNVVTLRAICNRQWKQRGAIADDPHVTANGGYLKRGMVSFAGGGTDSRTTQLFVSLRDSKYLGKANWETPIAQVVEGMDVVDTWYKGCASIDPISLPTLQRHRKLCHLEAFDVLASSTVAI